MRITVQPKIAKLSKVPEFFQSFVPFVPKEAGKKRSKDEGKSQRVSLNEWKSIQLPAGLRAADRGNLK